MYHQITLNMLVMTDNPPEPTLESLTLFLIEQTQCIANVTVSPLVAQSNGTPIPRQATKPVSYICNNATIVPEQSQTPPIDPVQVQLSRSIPTSTDTTESTPPPTSGERISKLVLMTDDDARIARIRTEPGHSYPRYYSHNDSWISVRKNGRHYFYDSVQNYRGETNRPIRFRVETGELETLYTAYNYIRAANKYAMGTRDNRRRTQHIWLTRTEAATIRRRVYPS